MFIEKLTDNQVKLFLEQEYPSEEGWSYSWHFFNERPRVCATFYL